MKKAAPARLYVLSDFYPRTVPLSWIPSINDGRNPDPLWAVVIVFIVLRVFHIDQYSSD
jgi:hypothetical protein